MKLSYDISAHVHKSVEDLKTKTSALPAPGKACFLITGVEDASSNGKTAIQATCEIVAHEDPTQIGKVVYQRCWATEKGAEGITKLAIATGVMTPQQWSDHQLAGTASLDTDDLVHKMFCGTIKTRTYTNKEGEKKPTCDISWPYLSVNDEEAKDYPRVIGGKVVNASPAGESAAAPPEKELTDDEIPF